MLKHSILAFVCLTSPLSALPIVWQGGNVGDPTDLSEPLNWSGGAVPNQPNAIAQFDTTGVSHQPTLVSGLLSLSNITFPLEVNPYSYTLQITGSTFSIPCDNGGIVNLSGTTQTFNLGQTVAFIGSAGNSTNSPNVLLNLSGVGTALNVSGFQMLNISNTDGLCNVALGSADLTVGSANANLTYAGTISGTASGTLNKIGTGTFALSGNNLTNFDWGTILSQGTVSIVTANNIGTGQILFDSDTFPSTTSQLQILNVSPLSLANSIQIAPGFTAEIYANEAVTLSGGVTDLSNNGNLFITGPGSVTFSTSNSNTYTGLTSVDVDSSLIAGNNNTLSAHSDHFIDGTLSMNNGTNDFTNEIFSLSGSGVVETGLHGTGALTVIGNNSTYFSGALSGNGAFNLQGGALLLDGDSSAFAGTTAVTEGAQLTLNGSLGGTTTIESGTLSGTGSASRVTLMSGSTISPGNSIGTLSFNSYTQNFNTIYNVEINDAGQSDLIAVSGTPGTAVLNGGTVVVYPIDGIDFGAKYTILTASGGVFGQFSNVTSAETSPYFIPFLDYSDPNAVFLTVKTALINGAVSYNERQVATQLDSLTANSDPDPELNSLLNALVGLSPAFLTDALDQLSGDPYTNDPFIVGTLNRQFIRRLYDPIRYLVTTSPECLPCTPDFELWIEGGWNRSFTQNDGNSFGFNLNGWEITLGGQKTFCDALTIGIAGSYEHDFVHYNIDSRGKLDSGFVGLYGLYRPEEFYLLVDLAFGYTNNRVQRFITIGDLDFATKSNPNIYDITFYGEGGFDIPATWALIQPFIGIEASGFFRPSFTESGAADLDLNLFKRNRGSATGRLGLHLTTAEICSFSLSFDGAWNYRLTSDQFLYNQSFVGFGTPFALEGVRLNRNSGEAAVTLSSQVNENVRLWAEYGGEVWRNASNFFISAGLQATF